MFIDSHCHLNLLEKENGELESVLAKAKENEVDHILCIAIDKATCQDVVCIAERYSDITASVGIHPNVEQQENYTVDELVSLAQHEKVIAIGETGLDYFRSEGDLTWQRARFLTHINAAKEANKPLIIHTREAREDTMAMLEKYHAREAGGIIHCFTENWETAQRALDMGFYISFSGIVTFKSAVELQQVAKQVPLDRMLIETDAPYLAPVPHRGKTNQPAFVKHVAEFIAKLRDESVETVAKITSDNFKRLFPTAIR